MKACILLNGKIEDLNFLKKTIDKENYDYIICADGGANFLYKIKVVPDYILGDLDSLELKVKNYFKEKGVNFKKFPERKNETDTQLCIHLAKGLGIVDIDLLGALGGRIDHTVANINLMYYIKKLGLNPVIKNNKEDLHMIESEYIDIFGKKGDTISVLPVNGDSAGITLEGLEYPLKDATIEYGDPIGISNVMESDKCRITVEKGTLLIVKNIEPV